MLRFVIIASVVVVVAIAAPRFAPALFELVAGASRSPVVAAGDDAQVVPPQPAPAPAIEVEAPTLPERTETVQALTGVRVSVPADAAGHYVVDARINGRAVRAMVDTGASTVALSAATARQLGVIPPHSAYTRDVGTANGVVKAAQVRLAEVRIGSISVRNVEALVIPGDALSIDLLGMTFLGRLQRFESSGGQLLLVQ